MEQEIIISKGNPQPYGSTLMANGVNFALYAKNMKKLSLCFFHPNDPTPFKEIEMDPKINKTGEVWHALIKGLPPSVIYGYRGVPNDQENKSYMILDPYAKCVASAPEWSDHRQDKEPPYKPLAKVISTSEFDWEGTSAPAIPLKDLIIYEMHVRGFTRDNSSQVSHPGTYRGLIEKIPYLLELGVNAVELMPVYEFNENEVPQIDPETHSKLHNYFGYSTVNFFSPMNRYASKSDADQAVVEFKTMVRELHKNGIEVILDVVYNHTAEGTNDPDPYSFRALDKQTYYMIDPQGNYLNFSGCGNTFNCNHPIAHELILDSLRYWVTEMHVDGFRFDLAPILTRLEDGTPVAKAPLTEAITKDPILAKTKLIAEAWDAAGLYQVGGFVSYTNRWSDWNGKYRDVVRRFIKGTAGHKNLFATALCGSQDLYGNGRSPTCSINFITAHDGFTLADLVTYNDKHNEKNGEENRDGFNYNDSWNCGYEGHSSNKKIISLRERQIRNFFLALMVSQGVPMILMGDEYAHTRNGNNNTWCQDNALNWFLWNQLEERPGFLRYCRSLIHFRKNHPLLKRDAFLGEKEITWHGVNPENPEWENDNRFIAFTLHGTDQESDIFVAFNAGHLPITIHLPAAKTPSAWFWVVNTHNETPLDFYEPRVKVDSNSVRIHSYSSIMLEAISTAAAPPPLS